MLMIAEDNISDTLQGHLSKARDLFIEKLASCTSTLHPTASVTSCTVRPGLAYCGNLQGQCPEQSAPRHKYATKSKRINAKTDQQETPNV
eukprot:760357-Amphidinium_carterae.1